MTFAASLADPPSSSSLLAATLWIQGTVLGTVAAVVAILAVAAVGAGLFSGRTDVRRGGIVIIGCFILFGAPAIATGLLSALSTGEGMASAREAYVPPATPPPPATRSLPPAPVPYDPYAGAAVPVAR